MKHWKLNDVGALENPLATKFIHSVVQSKLSKKKKMARDNAILKLTNSCAKDIIREVNKNRH